MSTRILASVHASPRRGLACVAATLLLSTLLLSGCAGGPVEGVLRLGYFPNLTHAQPLYGVTSGLYQEKLGPTRLEVTTFNAGPSAFEALLSGRVDVIYVGPSPTITTLERTGLGVVVIVAGAASGGARFIVQGDLDLDPNGTWEGRKFASPQNGNTQDVALKHYLKANGHTPTVVNTENAQILALFQKRDIDGAWVPEPWATRLIMEGGGKVQVNESELWDDGRYVATHLVATRIFFESREADLRNLLAAHVEATTRVASKDAEALATINDGIKQATQKALPADTLEEAIQHVDFTNDPLRETFTRQYQMSADLGFAKSPPADLRRVYDLSLLPTTSATASG